MNEPSGNNVVKISDRRRTAVFFIDPEFDDLDLGPHERSLYMRLARRAGGGKCFESVDKMAAGAGIGRVKAHAILKALVSRHIISKTETQGKRPNEYTLLDKTEWLTADLSARWMSRICSPHEHLCSPREHKEVNIRNKTPLTPQGGNDGQVASLDNSSSQCEGETLLLPLGIEVKTDQPKKAKPRKKRNRALLPYTAFNRRVENHELDIASFQPERFERLWVWAREQFKKKEWETGPKYKAQLKWAFLLDLGRNPDDIEQGVKLAIEIQVKTARWSHPIENFLYDGRPKKEAFRWELVLASSRSETVEVLTAKEFKRKYLSGRAMSDAYVPAALEALGNPTNYRDAVDRMKAVCPELTEVAEFMFAITFNTHQDAA